MYLLLEKVIFQLAMVSFLKNNCNNCAQLKRHHGTALCRSSTTKTNNFTYLGLPATLRCQPPKLAEKKNNMAERHQVLTYWRERSFMIKRAEFWYISEIWLFLFQSDKLTSMSHHILHPLERENPSIVSLVLSHDLMKSAVYIFSAFISQ